jgi:hypothetical protein
VVGMAGAQDFFHRPSPLAGRTMLTLAVFDEVKPELKLTPDEGTKLEGLIEKMGGDVMETVTSAGGDIQAITDGLKKINAKYDVEALKVLTPDQTTRLKQLYIQFNGDSTVPVEWVSKELMITDDQKAKVKKLEAEQNQKMMDAFQSGGGSPDEAGPVLKRIKDEFDASIDKILTDDQRTKLKDMQGAKFEFKKS